MKARAKAQAIAVEHIDPKSLRPWPDNPRAMSDEDRAALVRSVRRFGIVDPFIARREDRLVIGGHQRLQVALDEGLSPVPVVFLDGLGEQEAAALNVALNNIGGRFVLSSLVPVLESLTAGLLPVTGFTGEQLKAMLSPPDEFALVPEGRAAYCCPKCGHRWEGDPLAGEKKAKRDKARRLRQG